MKKIIVTSVLLIILVGACTPYQAQQQGLERKVQRRGDAYIPKNDIEFKNYNRRQKIADDPTAILWCTFFPFAPGQEPFTVPIVGKLTSSGKRPFRKYSCSGCEEVQPDAMFGSSSEYRYGFTPADFYIDFTDLSSFCTTQPTVWQRNHTTVILEVESNMDELNKQARQALKNGDQEKALELLRQATKGQDD